MEVTITNGNPIVVKVRGRLNVASATEFEELVNPALGVDRSVVEFDLSELEYISSAGLRSFMLFKRAADKSFITLIIKNCHPLVKEVFDMTGFTPLFTFKD